MLLLLAILPTNLPAFSLFDDKPVLDFPEELQWLNVKRPLTAADLKGKVSLFNVWATWCVACRSEHPVLMQLAETGKVAIYGLNYKDDRAEAKRWLLRYGDPYLANAFDDDGRVGIDWGVYGTPETFIVDQQGIIRHKHIGPLTREVVRDEILPLVEKLEAGSG